MPLATADLRWVRAVVVAVVAATLGATAHVLAGGLLPGWGTSLAIVATLAVVSAAALGRPASYAVIATLVAGGQTVVHVVLTATSGHGGTHAPVPTPRPVAASASPPEVGGGYARMMTQEPATTVPGGTGTPHWVQHLLDDLTGPNALMAVAHLAAAALVSAWLWKGEQAVWGLVALLGAHVGVAVVRLRSPAPVLAPAAPPRPRPVTTDVVSLVRAQRSASRGTAARRGPPTRRSTLHITPAV